MAKFGRAWYGDRNILYIYIYIYIGVGDRDFERLLKRTAQRLHVEELRIRILNTRARIFIYRVTYVTRM